MMDSDGKEWSKRSLVWIATEQLCNVLADILHIKPNGAKQDIVWDADEDDNLFPDFFSRMEKLGLLGREAQKDKPRISEPRDDT